MSIDRTEELVTNEERLAIENTQLKIQILQGQLDFLFKTIVTKYNIDTQAWSYDVAGGKFVSKNK